MSKNVKKLWVCLIVLKISVKTWSSKLENVTENQFKINVTIPVYCEYSASLYVVIDRRLQTQKIKIRML